MLDGAQRCLNRVWLRGFGIEGVFEYRCFFVTNASGGSTRRDEHLIEKRWLPNPNLQAGLKAFSPVLISNWN